MIQCYEALAGISDPEATLKAVREALEQVKKAVDNSDYWWMSSPDRGGIDMEKVEAALALLPSPTEAKQ